MGLKLKHMMGLISRWIIGIGMSVLEVVEAWGNLKTITLQIIHETNNKLLKLDPDHPVAPSENLKENLRRHNIAFYCRVCSRSIRGTRYDSQQTHNNTHQHRSTPNPLESAYTCVTRIEGLNGIDLERKDCVLQCLWLWCCWSRCATVV